MSSRSGAPCCVPSGPAARPWPWTITCRTQLEEALDMEGPVIIEAVAGCNELPMPPKVKPIHTPHRAAALAHGEPNHERMGLTHFRNIVDEAALRARPSGVVGRAMQKVQAASLTVHRLPGSAHVLRHNSYATPLPARQ
jgi:hypothetical protein